MALHAPMTATAPVVQSHTFTCPPATSARCRPSRWNATLTTESVPVFSAFTTSHVRLFRTLTVPSPSAQASSSPSALNATQLTSAGSRRTRGSTLHSRIR